MMSKRNWSDVGEVELLYPAFRKWVKETRGFLTCPALAEIKLWYEFMSLKSRSVR